MNNLKPGDTVTGVFQNFKRKFKVSKIQPNGPDLYLDHHGGEVRVRKQDMRDDDTFELQVKPRP